MKVRQISFKNPEAPELFVQSLKETGFAVLTDHPVSWDLVTQTYQDWEKFFKSETKHNYTFKVNEQSGYFPFRTENAKDYSKKDLKEFFHYYPWAKLPEVAQKNTPELYKALKGVAVTLLTWLENKSPTEVQKNYSMPLTKMIEKDDETLLRVLHYPPMTGQEEEGAVRAAAHEDINLITILVSGTAPGLQAMDVSGQWHDVPCDPQSIIVNSGDMLKVASGNYFPSTTHRVVNPVGSFKSGSRYSMPLFLHPSREIKLSNQYTAGSYLDERLKEIGLKK